MSYYLNTTDEYYLHDKDSLNWELTVCNALQPEKSPCRQVLQNDSSFGCQLFYFLNNIFPFSDLKNILEIGGGFGHLMLDLLNLVPDMRATMLDISPYLLAKQKMNLAGRNVTFLKRDILTMKICDLMHYDLAILNENLGDFPTLVTQSPDVKSEYYQTQHFLDKLAYFRQAYQLTLPPEENINIGALEVLDNLCLAGIRYIFLSEHSCEATLPPSLKPFIHFASTVTPERIPLKNHDEYTIKFSHLQKLAQSHDYRVIRGQFIDFLPLNCTDRVRTALRLSTPFSDEQEIIQQFVYDLYKYEYLVLIKGGKS
jgi:hypothetical protein